MNSMSRFSDNDQLGDSVSGKMESSWSQYSDEQYPSTNLGLRQIYNTGSNHYSDKIGLTGMSMMSVPEARNRMPFSPLYHHKESYDDLDQQGYDDDDDDDEADVDDGGEDEDEAWRTRSHIHRHDDDEAESEDNDEVEYSNRFYRKDKIAQNTNKGNTTREFRINLNRAAHH